MTAALVLEMSYSATADPHSVEHMCTLLLTHTGHFSSKRRLYIPEPNLHLYMDLTQ